MIRHEQLKGMVVCPGELSPAGRILLHHHLAQCPDCGHAASLYEENRARLRTLSRPQAPSDLRRTVLMAAEDSAEALSIWAPVAIALLTVPITLVTLTVAAEVGSRGMLVVALLIAGYCTLTAWRIRRLERGSEVLEPERRWEMVGTLARSLCLDLLGIAGGTFLLYLVLWLLADVSGAGLPVR